MSDSVGKISLDLEVQSDLAGQISSISNLIGKNLKTSLESTTKNAFNNMNRGIKGSLNNMSSSMKNTFGKMQSNLKGLFASFKNIKMPRMNFERPTNQTDTGKNPISYKSGRGPPVNGEMLGAKIQNVTATLDTINARIEQQQEKLAQLRESYSRTFNQSRKNKLEGQMLKTEAAINKLIGQSDKLGFELSELDVQYAALGANASKATGGTNKLSNSMKNLENNTKRASNSFRSSHSGLSMFLGTMIKWGIVFPIIQRGIMAMATSLGQSLMTNQQFANSLAQIKTNLSVAFTPVFNAILPALNALMSALATATTYIASFISAIFGKTYQQSYSATQSLIGAKAAMGAYGDATEKAGKQAKKAQGSLAGFDEINTLNMDNGAADSGGGGGGGGVDIPTLTPPSIDTSAVDSSMKRLIDKIKGFISTIDFTPLKKSFENLKASIVPIVENIGRILSWFMTNILGPLTKWTIEDLLPAFFNLLASAFKVLNPLLEVFMSLGKWLWDNFLQPIAVWTGGLIVDVLNGLADALTRIGQWISENKTLMENLILVIGSFALAWGIVTLALKAWTLVCGIATIITGALGAVMGFITSPIGIVILIIGALIAIGVLLYKNWDFIKAKAIEIFEFIKNWVKSKCDQIGNFFKTLWTKITDTFKNIGKWFSTKFTEAKNGVCNAFANIANWFSEKYKAILRVFSGVSTWFGNKFTEAKNAIVNKFSPIGKFFSNLFSSIKNIFSKIGTAVSNAMSGAFKAAINGVLGFAANTINGFIRAINGAIGLINKIPGVNISAINTMRVPRLAKGGILDSPTLAMVGEAGKEAVVPLENNTGGLDLLASKLLERMPQSDNSGFGDGDLILQVDGSVIGKVALKQLRKMQRQGNITLIPT